MVRPKMSLICVEKITTAMPEVKSRGDGEGDEADERPMRQTPKMMRKTPAIKVQISRPEA